MHDLEYLHNFYYILDIMATQSLVFCMLQLCCVLWTILFASEISITGSEEIMQSPAEIMKSELFSELNTIRNINTRLLDDFQRYTGNIEAGIASLSLLLDFKSLTSRFSDDEYNKLINDIIAESLYGSNALSGPLIENEESAKILLFRISEIITL
jgi:hypothetical protein